MRQGKLSADVSAELQQLADKNIPVGEYANHLNQLVKDGKLTPEQARELLEQYKKQHKNGLLLESAKQMDEMIKSGQAPLDAANQLLTMQKNNTATGDYAAKLQELVKQGKITPEVAQQLLAQYAQQQAKQIIDESIVILRQMGRNGEIIAEVEKDLIELETRMVPIDEFEAALKKHMQAGKLIPAISDKILDEYKEQKAAIGPVGGVNQLLQQAEQAAYGELSDLLQSGQITQEVANQLSGLIQKNVPFESFVAVVNQLVQQKKLTPELSKLKIADYKAVYGLRKMSENLTKLQANNAPSGNLADELKKAVQSGLITPEQAAEFLRQYEAANVRGRPKEVAKGSTKEFVELQERLAQGAGSSLPTAQQFETPVQEDQTISPEELQAQQAQIDAIRNAMSNQAGQLVGAWQPVAMVHKEGSPPPSGDAQGGTGASASGSGKSGTAASSASAETTPALIKAGSVVFAVLDTAVNSDYPDTPVMATIVDGPLKGSKLMGRLVTTKGVTGQLDRVSLNFTLMNADAWPRSRAVTAYAIDPDTARTVLASHVDYHYLQRFGAIMATSFIQGYSNAIGTSSSTTTTGIFGTSTTHPELSASQKIATGLGQIGQTLGAVTQNYVNIPPTVKVDSGVGLGILFMSDVT